MKITQESIEQEKLRMDFEMLRFGRWLLVGNRESQYFWRIIRKEAGNRWWKFWSKKSDEEIIKKLTPMKTNWQEDYRKLWLKNPNKIKDIELFIQNIILSQRSQDIEKIKSWIKKDMVAEEIKMRDSVYNGGFNDATDQILSLNQAWEERVREIKPPNISDVPVSNRPYQSLINNSVWLGRKVCADFLKKSIATKVINHKVSCLGLTA